MTTTATQPTTRRASARTVGLVAAAISLVYGVLALAFPYPRITDPPFEVVWAIVSLGYVGTLTAWVRSWPGPVPALGRIGWGVAVAGLLVRVADVAWFVVQPTFAGDGPVIAGILLTFTGLALLGSPRSGAPRGRGAGRRCWCSGSVWRRPCSTARCPSCTSPSSASCGAPAGA